MLSPEGNARLTLVEGNAIMGQLIRRFWPPFGISADLPEPGCRGRRDAVSVSVRPMGR